MVQPSIILQNELYALKYPNKTSFRFDGFQGLGNKERLISHIVDSALKADGTELVKGSIKYTP